MKLQDLYDELNIESDIAGYRPSDTTSKIDGFLLALQLLMFWFTNFSLGGDPDVYAYWRSSQVICGLNFSNYNML